MSDSKSTQTPASAPEPSQQQKAQLREYAEQYDKAVKPQYDMAMKFVGFGVDYFKVALSYMILANAGGLAGIVALQPLVKDTNQLWLRGAIAPAICFAVGLLLAWLCAAAAYHNHMSQAHVQFSRAHDHDIRLRQRLLDIDEAESRTWSAPKGRPIQIELPDIQTPEDLLDAHAVVSSAVSDGTLTAQDGALLATMLETHRRAFELVAQERKIDQLDERVRDYRDELK